MAIGALLVFAGHNRIRYLLVQDGGAGTTLSVTTTGAVTPDLLTNSVQGPIKRLAKVITDGYQQFASGAQTTAKAKALWLSDRTGADPNSNLTSGATLTPTAICKLTPQTGVGPAWTVDAAVSAGNPILSITGQAAAGTCYLDVEVLGAIGA